MRFLVILVVVLLSGCTSTQTLDKNLEYNEISGTIKKGKKIIIQTHAGDKFSLVVKEFTQDSIVGEDKEVLLKDIREIKVRRISGLKTTGAAITGSVVVTYILALLFVSVIIPI